MRHDERKAVTGSLNMLGGPGGTLEDELDTVRLNIESKVDHPLVSIVQPYPEFELNDITREMGIAVDDYDDFPTKFNRTATIDVRDKTAVENLHKWFPMVVKMPSLMPVAKLTMKQGWLKKPTSRRAPSESRASSIWHGLNGHWRSRPSMMTRLYWSASPL